MISLINASITYCSNTRQLQIRGRDFRLRKQRRRHRCIPIVFFFLDIILVNTWQHFFMMTLLTSVIAFINGLFIDRHLVIAEENRRILLVIEEEIQRIRRIDERRLLIEENRRQSSCYWGQDVHRWSFNLHIKQRRYWLPSGGGIPSVFKHSHYKWRKWYHCRYFERHVHCVLNHLRKSIF